MFESWNINIVNSKVRPIERGLHRIKRDRFVYLVHLGDIQDRLRPIDLLEILNDFQNGWLGSVEVQAGRRLQGVSPRRPEEDNRSNWLVRCSPFIARYTATSDSFS